jgi:hypothetical protein
MAHNRSLDRGRLHRPEHSAIQRRVTGIRPVSNGDELPFEPGLAIAPGSRRVLPVVARRCRSSSFL